MNIKSKQFADYDDENLCEQCGRREKAGDGNIYCKDCLDYFCETAEEEKRINEEIIRQDVESLLAAMLGKIL